MGNNLLQFVYQATNRLLYVPAASEEYEGFSHNTEEGC